MVNGIIGKKIGMTQLFDNKGDVRPVTVLQAGPCVITQRKSANKDGYDAAQIGLVEFVKETRLSKARARTPGKNNLPPVRTLRVRRSWSTKARSRTAMRRSATKCWSISSTATKFVDVTGVSKGRGFAGVVKRHKFAGGAKSHGSMFQITGSIGSSAFPSRVFKGMRMSGHMGPTR